jgi:opacity protein-like surface antigen
MHSIPIGRLQLKASWLALTIIFVLFFAAPLSAQTQFDVFGGYSYIKASVSENGVLLCPGPPCPTKTFGTNPNLNGWEASVEYKLTDAVGFLGDFGGSYGSLPAALGSESTHTNTYLFGPQIAVPARISPFAHVLLGVAHQSTASGAGSGYFFAAHSGNAFAMALGGGVDFKVIPSVWVRVIQVDYLASNFPTNLQNQARISAGVVFHF